MIRVTSIFSISISSTTGHAEIISIANSSGISQIGDDCISKARVAMLEDYDVTSCYDIINTSDTIILDRRMAVNNIIQFEFATSTRVNVTTYNMNCNDSFYLSLYHRDWNDTCGSESIRHCVLLNLTEIHTYYTLCEFECSCRDFACANPDVIFLKVSHPMEGGLCDITVAPAIT